MSRLDVADAISFSLFFIEFSSLPAPLADNAMMPPDATPLFMLSPAPDDEFFCAAREHAYADAIADATDDFRRSAQRHYFDADDDIDWSLLIRFRPFRRFFATPLCLPPLVDTIFFFF